VQKTQVRSPTRFGLEGDSRLPNRLKCDRGQPCQTCARRGLPCTYVTSNPSKRTGHNQVRPSPTTDPNIPDRIGQLERLVTSLMSNAKPTVQSSSGTQSLAHIEFPAVSGQESEGYVIPHDSSQLPGLFGRITQNATGTTYVESTHWSAILGGVRCSLTSIEELPAKY